KARHGESARRRTGWASSSSLIINEYRNRSDCRFAGARAQWSAGAEAGIICAVLENQSGDSANFERGRLHHRLRIGSERGASADQNYQQTGQQIVRHHGIEAREPARSAPLCGGAGNSACPGRNGHCDPLHPAWCLIRARSEKTKHRWGIAGLRLVNFYVANRKQINCAAGQSEGERRQRWGGGGGRPERQIKLEIAARYFGQGREQSRLAGAGGGNAKRESITWTFARASQQHGARSKRRF